MLDPTFFDNLVKKFSASLPESLQTVRHDLEKNLHAVLQSAFARLDLITREEFDAQAKVLIKTREKLEKLEHRLAEIEKKAKPKKK
jgi:BMFP domain-containing protein YqiC